MKLCLFGGEKVLNSSIVRAELKRMKEKDLLDLAFQQKKRWCNVGASECSFFIQYRGSSFCLMELLGQGCFAQLQAEMETNDQGSHVKEYDHPQLSTLWSSNPNNSYALKPGMNQN
jgi:hypothetical protein